MKYSIILTVSMCIFSGLSHAEKNHPTKDHVLKDTNGTTNYTISKHVVSSGGGIANGTAANGDSYAVTSSIAQLGTGHKATGGAYRFNGGFLGASLIDTDLIFKTDFE